MTCTKFHQCAQSRRASTYIQRSFCFISEHNAKAIYFFSCKKANTSSFLRKDWILQDRKISWKLHNILSSLNQFQPPPIPALPNDGRFKRVILRETFCNYIFISFLEIKSKLASMLSGSFVRSFLPFCTGSESITLFC